MPKLPTKLLGKALGSQSFVPLLAVCLGTALVAGFSVWSAPTPDASPKPQHTESADNVAGEIIARPEIIGAVRSEDPEAGPVPLASIRDLHLVDVLLTHGNVAQALDRYAEMEPPIGEADLHEQLLYRVCIAHEVLGRDDVAIELYGQLAQQASNPHTQLLAKNGKARIWIKTGKRHLARVVLAAAVIEDLAHVPARSPLAGEISHLLGLAFSEGIQPTDERVFQAGVAVASLPTWTPSDLLAYSEPTLSNQAEKQTSANPQRTSVSLVYQYGFDPTEIQLAAQLPKSPVRSLVEQLANAAKLQVVWSQAADKVAMGRATALASSSANLAVLLDTLLTKYDLIWQMSENSIQILSRAEFSSPEKLRKIDNRIAQRLLQHSVANHPEHSLAFFAHLALGNLQFEKEEYASAAAIYRHCIERFPRSTNTSIAEFNLAKSLMNGGDRSDALDLFFQVGDGTHGHPIQSPTNAFAGQLLLEDGNVSDSVRPLMRALSTATTPSANSRSALLLASAYLSADNPHAATQVLMESRDMLKDNDRVAALGAFLNAYAIFKVANDDVGISQSGRNLINSLSDLDGAFDLEEYWYLLIGRALHDVGLSNQMAATYEARLKNRQSVWIREQMQSELIRHWRETGNLQALRDHLANAERPKHRIILADAAFRQGKVEACITACRNLLESQDVSQMQDEDKLTCLNLLGTAYQSQGLHYQAALCFAGMLPADSADDSGK